jgi:hypothetical protein
LDHGLVTRARTHRPPGQPLRAAAIGGLAFTVLYVVHRLLQGTGPDGSSTAAVAAYQVAHRGALLASEVAVGLALLAFIAFLAALVLVIWRAGQEPLAVAVAISGGVFVALGFVSNAAETALIGVADANQPAAVLALNQLQGRTPIVWTITARSWCCRWPSGAPAWPGGGWGWPAWSPARSFCWVRSSAS